MEKKTSSSSNPWSELATVTTFDRGHSIRTTQRVDSSKLEDKQIVITPFSQSLLIEALVNKICEKVEHNKERKYNLYIAICEKLHHLNLIDGSYKMGELQPIQRVMREAFETFFNVAYATKTGNYPAIERPLAQSIYTQSRYHQEFVEVGHIADGGFGRVYKAMNRLDRTEYAIKKVGLDSAKMQTIARDLEEVQALAKLNHPNVVSYKCAWLEPRFGSRSTARLVEASNSEVSTDASDDSVASTGNCGSQAIGEDEDMISHSVSFRRTSKSTEVQRRSYSEVNTSSNDTSESAGIENRICTYRPIDMQVHAILYIQMALCEETLHHWLKGRAGRTPQPMIIEILTQIFKGLNYIHTQGIVHHDIKPSNIFISLSGPLTIQVGDFGLACRLQANHHSTMGGTPLYVAPEQSRGECNVQSDVYSAGIVLFELLVPTPTRMEQTELIEELKKGQLPTSLAVDYPKLSQLVSQLVQKDPEKRPTTEQVLKAISTDKDFVIAQLRTELHQKEQIIRERDLLIQQQRERILFLEAQFTASSKT